MRTYVFMELLFEEYIKKLNLTFDTDYKFVKIDQWNSLRTCLNKTFENSTIGSGHCLILTVIFMHYLSITTDPVDVAINKFSCLNDMELLEMINSYSVGFYDLMNSIY